MKFIQKVDANDSLRLNSLWVPTWPTVLLLTAASVLVVGQMYVVLPLYGELAFAFGTSPAALAWTSTSFGLAYAFTFLIVGPLVDSYGARRVIVTGLVATGITTCLVALAQSLTAMAVLRVLQGMSAATLAPASLSYISARVRPDRRALVIACVTSSMLASAVILQLAGAQISRLLGWRAVFATAAPLLACTAVVASRILAPAVAGKVTPLLGAVHALPGLLCDVRLFPLYLSTATLLGAYVGLFTMLTLVVPAQLALSAEQIAAMRIGILPAIFAAPVASRFLTTLSPVARAVFGLVLSATASLSAVYTGSSTILLGSALAVAAGGLALAAPALVEEISLRSGERRGAGTALYAFFMFIGGSFGGQAVAAMSDTDVATITRSIAALLAAGSILALISNASGCRQQLHDRLR